MAELLANHRQLAATIGALQPRRGGLIPLVSGLYACALKWQASCLRRPSSSGLGARSPRNPWSPRAHSRPRRRGRLLDPLADRGAGRRRRQRRLGELAVAVVRRERDDLGLRQPVVARTVADAGPHRRRARLVLPADARLVRDLPADRVLVAGSQLPGHRGRRRRCRGVHQAVRGADHGGVRGRRLCHPAARDVVRCRIALLCVHGGRRGLVDRVAGHLDTAKPRVAVGALRAGVDAVDLGQHQPGAPGTGLRRDAALAGTVGAQ